MNLEIQAVVSVHSITGWEFLKVFLSSCLFVFCFLKAVIDKGRAVR